MHRKRSVSAKVLPERYWGNMPLLELSKDRELHGNKASKRSSTRPSEGIQIASTISAANNNGAGFFVLDPSHPLAYACTVRKVEVKGRTNTDLQDERHRCDRRGVRSKCHVCENVACGENLGSQCSYQLQGVSRGLDAVTDTRKTISFGTACETTMCRKPPGTSRRSTSVGQAFSRLQVVVVSCPTSYSSVWSKSIEVQATYQGLPNASTVRAAPWLAQSDGVGLAATNR